MPLYLMMRRIADARALPRRLRRAALPRQRFVFMRDAARA